MFKGLTGRRLYKSFGVKGLKAFVYSYSNFHVSICRSSFVKRIYTSYKTGQEGNGGLNST
jgi:hypothetical protein